MNFLLSFRALYIADIYHLLILITNRLKSLSRCDSDQ